MRGAAALAACTLVLVVLVGQYQQRNGGSELMQPSQAVKHQVIFRFHPIQSHRTASAPISSRRSDGLFKRW